MGFDVPHRRLGAPAPGYLEAASFHLVIGGEEVDDHKRTWLALKDVSSAQWSLRRKEKTSGNGIRIRMR